MEAATLRCPSCGALASPDDASCTYCHASLATVACARCFGMMFVGAKHCSHCGAAASAAPVADGKCRDCPRCRSALQPSAVGTNVLGACGPCGGVWVDVATFEAICGDSERQAALLGAPPGGPTPTVPVRYVPCPECGKIMNRVNFARISGVVVDVCKPHGIWFDRDELRRVVEFIRRGGLMEERARELEELREERRRLAQQQALGDVGGSSRDRDGIDFLSLLMGS